jgi:hypothetical protein
MPLNMASGVAARVKQVLVDFLSAELATLDANLADGITTPTVPEANIFEWDRRVILKFPAITLRITTNEPKEVHPVGFGARVDAEYRVDVRSHSRILNAGEDALRMQDYSMRYADAIFTVLAVVKDGLQTSADDTRWATSVVSRGENSYGPEETQGSGEIARTATVPLLIRRIEQR